MQLASAVLPDIVSLRQRCQALALLDAIVSPEWEDRYYSFNPNWSTSELMGSMRNGEGDDWFILFGAFGAAIKGLSRKSPIAGDNAFVSEVQQKVPATFVSFLSEAAFEMDCLSYCYWQAEEDTRWQKVVHPYPALGLVDDGSVNFLSILIESAGAYQEFALWYYGLEVPLETIQMIYDHLPLNEKLVHSLNSDISLAQALEAASEIGYGR